MTHKEAFSNLYQNLIDVIKEAQLKIGYDRAPVRLYYPLESLNRLLRAQLDAEGMAAALEGFSAFCADTLGAVTATRTGERFCLIIPEAGVQYVHEQVEDPAFLRAFLSAVSRCPVSLEEILAVFNRFSDRVCCQTLQNEEFHYLIYFEDGVPDAYRYCIQLEEDGCAVYHRFTPEDYEAFGF